MTEVKIKMPKLEELDEYERELCESADPADHTALLMRIALKHVGIDPDGDDWYVSGHKMESSDPNLVIEEQKLHYRPVVKKVYKLPQIKGRTFLPGRTTGELELTSLMFPSPGSEERMINCKVHGWTEATMPDANYNVYCSKCMGGPTQSWLNKQAAVHVDKKVSPGLPGVVNLNWPKLTSLDSYQVKGRGTVKVVKATRRLLDIMADMHSDPGEHSHRHVEIDNESWIIVNFEYQGTPAVGDHICLVVKKPVMGMRARESLMEMEDEKDE